MSTSGGTMRSWPELVGWDGKVAKKQILAEDPYLRVIIIKENDAVTGDLDMHRVRIRVDELDIVAEVPQIG
ncbi:hypothetical protein O6H91_21G024900 [Diphasiastrum complanatum]|uniref:Uncharacterized protein n=1 Tax=Diphasiastrum complanatum TaxID=34168 RepID=A0ACC2AIS2_DIPCM|nr:hypothetical protein O6H91_21G024900 [Diphasiastrum complanatum]